MCMNLYRHIDRNKVQFDFVKHTHSIGAFESEISDLGGRIYEAPRFKPGNILRYKRWWRRHLSTHLEHQIIHGHFFTISPIYFKIAKQKGRKTLGHIHISKAENIKKVIFAKFISRYTDFPFACSISAGKWVYGKRPFKVINNAIDVDRFRFNDEKRTIVRNSFSFGENLVIGTVGRFDLQKNPYGIFEIFCQLHELRKDTKLLWVGNGPFREELMIKAKKRGLDKDILFTGVRSDVNDLLQAMDIYIMPSFYEGLPVAAIEAQACGLPCFISNQITNEVDITGRCTFLPIKSPEKWANEILNCKLKREDTGDIIIAAGYDINRTAKDIQDFYLSIVNSKN